MPHLTTLPEKTAAPDTWATCRCGARVLVDAQGRMSWHTSPQTRLTCDATGALVSHA